MDAQPHNLDNLRRAEDVSRQLMQLTLKGADVDTMLDDLAEMLGRPCALISTRGRLLASGAASTEQRLVLNGLLAALRDSSGFARAQQVDAARALGHALLEDVICLGPETVHQIIAPVVEGRNVSSLLAIWARNGSPGDWERLAVQHAATMIAFSGLRHHLDTESAEDVQQDLVARLLSGEFGDEDALRRRAAHHGVDPQDPHVVLVIAPRDHAPDSKLLQRIRAHLREHAGRGVVVAHGDRVVVLLPLPRAPVAKQEADWAMAQAEELSKALERIGQAAVVGAADACRGLRSLAHGAQEAERAAWIGLRLFHGACVCGADSLWFYSMLVRARNTGNLGDSWNRLLADLIAEDEQAGGQLLPTLDVFLDCQQNFTEAARHLYVHPNTVRYRLNKIKKVIGRAPLEDPMLRTAYHMALKAALLFGYGATDEAAEGSADGLGAPYTSLATSAST